MDDKTLEALIIRAVNAANTHTYPSDACMRVIEGQNADIMSILQDMQRDIKEIRKDMHDMAESVEELEADLHRVEMRVGKLEDWRSQQKNLLLYLRGAIGAFALWLLYSITSFFTHRGR